MIFWKNLRIFLLNIGNTGDYSKVILGEKSFETTFKALNVNPVKIEAVLRIFCRIVEVFPLFHAQMVPVGQIRAHTRIPREILL
jgi:hypothetical protein